MKILKILSLFAVVYTSVSLKAQSNDTSIVIYPKDSTTLLKESVVFAERLKGKKENGKTIFFINNTILSASGSAPDMLRHIPGIQVDLKQNISLEGSSNILLFVNGKERDRSFISQLNPSQIDKVEILNTPPSNYDGSATGVINIILKKSQENGFSGQLFTELPTSKSIVYSFPTLNLQYVSDKLTLYASYNGEINFENIDETYNWQIMGSSKHKIITSVEQVRQKNLSHKFHYGADYQATPRSIINYYGSINPYSYEQDGPITISVEADSSYTHLMQREERDKNLNIYNSIYYKHLFNRVGQELTIDISNSILKSDNCVSYLTDAATPPIFIAEQTKQISTTIKADLISPIGENILLSTGLRTRFWSMQNEYALYGSLNYKKTKYNLNFGLRAEFARELSVLPYLTFQYHINTKQSLLFSYRRSVNRPNVYQLNPDTYLDNPFSVRKGNPLLEPELRSNIYAEHSIKFGVNFISYRLFYEKIGNAINNLTTLKEGPLFETQLQNLGDIHQIGIHLSGSIKWGLLAISTSARLYNQSTTANTLAKQLGIQNRQNLVFEAGLSSVLSFKQDLALSGTLQYSTKKHNIQESTSSGALYIFTLDKTFRENLKLGIMTALPFAKTFTYQQREVSADNFSTQYTGLLKLPTFPLMLRVSYQFKIGKERVLVNRERDEAPRKERGGL